jgi:hypothetical protein
MTPLAPNTIHARRRPLAIAFVFLAEVAWALLLATPTHAWARHAWGGHPDGDAVLFTGASRASAGGRALLVWLGQEDAGLSITARTTIVLLAVGAVLMQLPLGALVASLAFGREPEADVDASEASERRAPRSLRLVEAWRVAAASFLPLAALLALGAVVSVLVLTLGGLAASVVDHALADSLGDARAFTVRLVVLGLFAALAALAGIVVDLARVAVVRETGIAAARGASAPAWSVMLRGGRAALVTARRSLGKAALGWTGRIVVAVALVAIGYVASDVLGGRGGTALTALFVVHQGVILGRVALRASWLARALSLVAPVQDERTPRKEQEEQETAPMAGL